MSVVVDILSTRSGVHELWIGMDANELADFRIMCWITKYGHRLVDCVQAMGLNFISFMGGDLWIHNDDNTDRCNLFGEKRDCVVGIVSNEQPTIVKVYDSIGVQSDDSWEITSITLPPTLNYPDGQWSKIPTEHFKKRSGLWRARFLRNMKSTTDTASVLDAIKGEELRGSEMYLTMKNTSNDQVKLFLVEVNATNSRV